MPKSNYGQVKRQKEALRKVRQQKKLERRQARVPGSAPDDTSGVIPSDSTTPPIPDGEMPP